jgi:hypothetical protein
VVILDDVKGFQIFESSSVPVDVRHELTVAGYESSSVVRYDPIAPPFPDDCSPICAYYSEFYEGDDDSESPCTRFLCEVGLFWARKRPKRTIIIRQKTAHDLPIALTRRDIEKLQHLYQQWQRQVERSEMYDEWEAAKDSSPEPEYEEDSLDESWSDFYNLPNSAEESEDEDNEI